MYTNPAQRKHPGLFVVLVDQSGSMENQSPKNGYPLAKNVSDSINIVLSELIEACTKPVGDEDSEVRDYYKIVIIGYGGEESFKATVLENSKLSEIEKKYPSKSSDTVMGNMIVRNIVQPVAGFVTPMSEAFAEAKRQIKQWANEGHNGPADPSPIVMNITDGAPTDETGYVTEEALQKTAEEATEIMNLQFPDGSPRIFNVMMSDTDANQISFPNNNNNLGEDVFAKFLFLITSTIDEEAQNLIKAKNLGNPAANSKFLMINVIDPSALVKFMEIGTRVKGRML